MKIATLVPAATDIVAALGFASDIVAVSHECDHPTAANAKVVTGSNVPAAGVGGDAEAADVDGAVSTALAAGDALYTVDTTRLRSLSPDVIVSQTICDVCAVRRDHFSDELPDTITYVDLNATSVDGLHADIDAVASALGVPDRGDALSRSIAERIGVVRQRSAGRRNRPVVASIEWSDPLFIGGHWVPEVVDLAGGVNAIGDSSVGVPSHRVDPGDVVASAPDVVLVLPCGYDLQGCVDEALELMSGPLAALATTSQFWAVDANRLFSRCTPAIATAAELVSTILDGGDVDPMTARRVDGR